jgi:hypothetical protein
MTPVKSIGFKVAASALALSAFTGLLAPATASAALVTGTATISIDNTAFTASNIWGEYVEKFWDASYNSTGIGRATTGGLTLPTTGVTAMAFPVNTNTVTVNDPTAGAYGRSLQATTMDANDTSTGQIGLSGAWRINGPGGMLTPYDFRLIKTAGTWNIGTFDTVFKFQNFLQLTNVSESLNASGQLLLSGDLMWTSLWATMASAKTNVVVGSISLAPAAVPVPAAVWMFASGLGGMLLRRKRVSR